MAENIVFFILLFFAGFTEPANILVVIPYGRSHYIMQRPIGLELARRGHNVTVITSFEEREYPENYHQVVVDGANFLNYTEKSKTTWYPPQEFSNMQIVDALWTGGIHIAETVFKSNSLQYFLAQNNTFDLVICQYMNIEAIYILAYRYSAPLVLITTYGNSARQNILMRNPLQVWALPFDFCIIPSPATFVGRLESIILAYYEYFVWSLWYSLEHDRIATKYVPNLMQPVPSVHDIQMNASLLLINSHFTFDSPVAYLPNVIEVGGLHLKKSTKPLPQDLQKIMDDAKDGVIYLGFGTHIKSTNMPTEMKNAFINVFRRLNQTILWKWESDILEGKPNNVFIRQWMPQNEILAHPNVKIFISHGGLMGTYEAIFNGVPIIGIPIYGDQYNNVLQVQSIGFGKLLEFKDISEKTLERTIREILSNNSYKENALRVSRRFKDRPLSPLEMAIYWIEYVIREKGAPHLKNQAMSLTWIQYHMLDVYLFILLCILIFLYIIYTILFYCCKYFLGRKRVIVAKEKKN